MAPERAPSSPAQKLLWPLALLGILAFVSWFRSKSKTPGGQAADPIHGHDSTNHGTNDSRNNSQRRIGITETNGPPSPAQCKYPEKKSKRGLKRWKPWVFLLNITTFIAVVWYACITKDMWKEMKTQTTTAQAQLEATERPWIKIVDVQTRGESTIVPALSFQRSPNWPPGIQQATFQLDIVYKNIGHSVAKVTADFQLFLPLWKDGYSDVILADEKSFCDSVTRVNPTPTLSVINFPGDDPYHWYGSGAATVNPNSANFLPDISPSSRYILPVVAVCISYQFGDSTKVYQTRALYEVFRKDNRTRFLGVGVGMPASKLFLVRNQSGDAAY